MDITEGNTILEMETMTVLEDNMAKDTTIESGGLMLISNGGVASNTIINDGRLYVFKGGVASDTVVNRIKYDTYYSFEGVGKFGMTYGIGGVFTVSSGGLAKGTTVNTDAYLIVSNGGTANNATIESKGYFSVFSGGTATEITISNGARFSFVVAPDTWIQGTYDGNAFEMKDAAISGFTVSSGCSMTVFAGGTASNIAVDSGVFIVKGGGSAVGIRTNAFLQVIDPENDDYGSIESGAYFSDCRISGAVLNNAGASAIILPGMSADSATITNGKLIVSSGGTATNILWTPCEGYVYVEDGGVATYASQYSGVYYRSEDQAVNETTVSDIDCVGEMYVMAGGTANNVTAYPRNWMYVSSGGLANDTQLYGGMLNVFSGGVANRTSVGSGQSWDYDLDVMSSIAGSLCVLSGGTANSTFVEGNGQLHISNGGMACDTTLSGIYGYFYDENYEGTVLKREFASMCVSSGGTASDTFIQDGVVFVSRGGVLANFTMDTAMECSSSVTSYKVYYDEDPVTITFLSPGIHLSAGAKLTGQMTFLNNARVFAVPGAILDFDLTQTAAGSVSLVNDLSAIDGSLSYTLTIDGSQANGTYRLADGISIFTDVIAVTNTSGNQLGVLFVGQKFTYGGKDYMLSIVQDCLTVTVQESEGDGVVPVSSGPVVTGVAADITGPTNQDVTVTAKFSAGKGLASSLYKLGENGEWTDYAGGVTVSANDSVFFKAVDATGAESDVVSIAVRNIDKTAPEKPEVAADITTQTNGDVLVTATFSADSVSKEYSFDGENWGAYPGGILFGSNRKVFFRGVDAAGNASEVVEYEVTNIVKGSPYVVEYSSDSFEHVLRVAVKSDALDSFRMPVGVYQWRSMSADSPEWMTGDPIVSSLDKSPTIVKSDEDGNLDLFFANASGVWESKFGAKHLGFLGGWSGTGETVELSGKNKLADIFEGSTDANILLMTDDSNGDALFVDDIYTALPGTLREQQARIAQIDEIRAGAGDDIVDMTSKRFEYVGDGMTIRGGDGDDTIWANKGDNFLFGDAGNDRIVGASGNDVIAGGTGDDSMHGGGGNDVFTFCDNWGADTVEQLETGSVTLWFTSGDESNWNAETLTYTDGRNSVTVSGVTADKVTLKFGAGNEDDAAQFASLSEAGAFDAFTSQNIFEESGSGILASL